MKSGTGNEAVEFVYEQPETDTALNAKHLQSVVNAADCDALTNSSATAETSKECMTVVKSTCTVDLNATAAMASIPTNLQAHIEASVMTDVGTVLGHPNTATSDQADLHRLSSHADTSTGVSFGKSRYRLLRLMVTAIASLSPG